MGMIDVPMSDDERNCEHDWKYIDGMSAWPEVECAKCGCFGTEYEEGDITWPCT